MTTGMRRLGCFALAAGCPIDYRGRRENWVLLLLLSGLGSKSFALLPQSAPQPLAFQTREKTSIPQHPPRTPNCGRQVAGGGMGWGGSVWRRRMTVEGEEEEHGVKAARTPLQTNSFQN